MDYISKKGQVYTALHKYCGPLFLSCLLKVYVVQQEKGGVWGGWESLNFIVHIHDTVRE